MATRSLSRKARWAGWSRIETAGAGVTDMTACTRAVPSRKLACGLAESNARPERPSWAARVWIVSIISSFEENTGGTRTRSPLVWSTKTFCQPLMSISSIDGSRTRASSDPAPYRRFFNART